jgi:glycosyltransferase involved in cell wall biosynthesis
MKENKKISLVIPIFNEEDAIAIFIKSINDTFRKTNISLEFIFVNDGSTDDSLDILVKERGVDSRITILDLSRNFGKEAALSAGLEYATGDCVVPIDGDLQDPPELIHQMLEKAAEGDVLFDFYSVERVEVA